MEMEGPLVILDHLMGYHSGSREIVSENIVTFGTSSEADIHFPKVHEPSVEEEHAVLLKKGEGFEISAVDEALVSVNLEPVSSKVLNSGDLIRLGNGGPLMRLRLYTEKNNTYKSITEALEDCIECSKQEEASTSKVLTFFKAIRAELSHLSPAIKGSMALLAIGMVAVATALFFWTSQLQKQIDQQNMQVSDLNEFWENQKTSDHSLDLLRDSLSAQLGEANAQLFAANERIKALEDRNEASQRIIGSASKAVILLQGSYGFVNSDGDFLRYRLDANGQVQLDESGNPALLLGGDGPLFESFYTGTGFVLAEENLIVTNRHVALPWEYDQAARSMAARRLKPVMHRFIGYLPGIEEAFDVQLVKASDDADVAILSCQRPVEEVEGLQLSTEQPIVGQEIFVMGYPTGTRALLARTNETFVRDLILETEMDFWKTAEKLSESGFITPLSTRGIIGQITDARLVYDAETTSGGSGGPVIGLDGLVYGVNAAILPEFGGSNLGVPAEEVWKLIR